MADKKELGYEGLGDITKLMHNQGVTDLSWLAVDEADYRAHEALPKQNLDIIPEFQKALLQEGDDRVPSLIPLRPHTIVNTNPLDKTYGNSSINYNLVPQRVAKYVMAGMSSSVMSERLQQEFSGSQLRASSTEVNEILQERGLLGNVYVDAKYLPRCAQDGADRKFATKVTKRALFVLAADKCTGCVCNKNGFCSSLQKRVVSSIPYSGKLANILNKTMSTELRSIDMSHEKVASSGELPVSTREWKERIRAAFLKSPATVRESSIQTIQQQHVPAKPVVTASDVQSFVERQNVESGVDPMPSPTYLKLARRVMQGYDVAGSFAGSQNPELQELVRNAGILGHTYLDMDALGGCRNTVSFMDRAEADGNRLTPDYILRRSASCPLCMGASDGACAQLCTKTEIVTQKLPITAKTFALALQRAASEKRITPEQAKSAYGRTATLGDLRPAVAYVNTMKPVEDHGPAEYSGIRSSAFHGDPGRSLEAAPMNPEEVRRNVSHMMNTGMHGSFLHASILKRYSKQDLAQVPEVGAALGPNDGIQGSYFIDPTAYADYGKGCVAGSKHFRKRGAPFIMASDSCTGCVLQTAPGWCSKYSKNMIRQVPEEVRTAAKKRVLPMAPRTPVENPVEKYELASELTIDVTAPKSRSLDISLPGRVVG